MNLFTGLAKAFLTSGVTKDEYNFIKNDIREANKASLYVLSGTFCGYCCIMVLVSLLLTAPGLCTVGWLALAGVFALFHFSARHMCRKGVSAKGLFYACVALLLIGCSMVADALESLFVFCTIVMILPVIFIDKPLRIIAFTGVFTTLFALTAGSAVTHRTIALLWVGFLVSSCLTVCVSYLRCKRLLDIYYIRMAGKRDELTGLYNRSAFKEFTSAYEKNKSSRLALICLDVDGLKLTNDNRGHDAGDELLKGAASCIEEAFGNAGICCRLGGDEFVVLLEADRDLVGKLCENFEAILGRWKGIRIPKLHVSYGCVFASDFEGAGFSDITRFADMKLYENKEAFYLANGVDRKRQQQAYDLICDTFDKILLVNLTEDTCRVVKTSPGEEDSEFETLTGWIDGFVKAGQVCADDEEIFRKKTHREFLKKYFREGNMYLSIDYRRNLHGVCNNAIMHIIPSGEYTHEKQIVFLYANIDGK